MLQRCAHTSSMLCMTPITSRCRSRPEQQVCVTSTNIPAVSACQHTYCCCCAVLQVTQDCCRAALDGKATSLQQDQEVLEQSASKRFRHRLTVQYRIGLKQALAKCAAL